MEKKMIRNYILIALAVFAVVFIFVFVLDNAPGSNEATAVAQLGDLVKKLDRDKSIIDVPETPDTSRNCCKYFKRRIAGHFKISIHSRRQDRTKY